MQSAAACCAAAMLRWLVAGCGLLHLGGGRTAPSILSRASVCRQPCEASALRSSATLRLHFVCRRWLQPRFFYPAARSKHSALCCNVQQRRSESAVRCRALRKSASKMRVSTYVWWALRPIAAVAVGAVEQPYNWLQSFRNPHLSPDQDDDAATGIAWECHVEIRRYL